MGEDITKPMKGLFILMRGGAIIIFGLIVLLVIVFGFGPTLAAAGSYLIHPHQVAIQGVSLRVPFSWELKKSNDHFAYIQKRSDLLLESDGAGDLLFITSHGAKTPLEFSEGSEREFKSAYAQHNPVPFQLSSRWNNCLRVADSPSDDWGTIECWDNERGIEFDFIGDNSTATEAAELVQ